MREGDGGAGNQPSTLVALQDLKPHIFADGTDTALGVQGAGEAALNHLCLATPNHPAALQTHTTRKATTFAAPEYPDIATREARACKAVDEKNKEVAEEGDSEVCIRHSIEV